MVLVLLEQPEKEETQVILAWLETPDCLVHWDLKETEDQMVHRVPMVLQVPKEIRDLKVLLDKKETEDLQD